MRGRRLWGRGSGIERWRGEVRAVVRARACSWCVDGAKALLGGAGRSRPDRARGSSRSPLSACRGDPAGERPLLRGATCARGPALCSDAVEPNARRRWRREVKLRV